MTQTEWENEMCIKILELIQNELYVDFRYLDVAVSVLDNCQYVCHRLLETAGCKTSRFGSIINEKPLPRLG